jgi:hypothetical protein
MATKSEITADIVKNFGNCLNCNQVGKFLVAGRKTTRVFLKDIPFVKIGREKKYLAIDIADKMCVKKAYR